MSNLTDREKIIQSAAVECYTKIQDIVIKIVLENIQSNSEQSYFFDNLNGRLNILCGMKRRLPRNED